jgi:hypothetical protein
VSESEDGNENGSESGPVDHGSHVGIVEESVSVSGNALVGETVMGIGIGMGIVMRIALGSEVGIASGRMIAAGEFALACDLETSFRFGLLHIDCSI